MSQYILIFVAGMAGSFHCVGMCGGFACVLGSDPRGAAATLRRHLVYNTGRVSTYVFLGALVGALGTALAGPAADAGPMVPAQRTLALVAGALMVFIGLQFFGWFRGAHGTALGAGGQLTVQSFQALLKAPGPGAPLAFGVLNGFLPCPLVYAFLAHTAALCLADPERGVALGASTMAAFGLGTFPAMLLTGWFGRLLRPAWRRRSVRFAGAFIVALGLVTIIRGVMPTGVHFVHFAHAHDGATTVADLVTRPGGAASFSLVDHTGRSVTEQDFRGRFMLVYFGYTHCPDVCPMALTSIAAALDALGAAAREVQPVFITVDPGRDTVDVLASYVGHFHPRLVGLSGSPQQIDRAKAAFGVRSGRSDAYGDAAAEVPYTVSHGVLTFLVGPHGNHLDTFLPGTPAETMAARIRQRVEFEFVKGFLLQPPALSAAYQAFASGDYAAAFETYRDFARQGDAAARNNLGVMYEVGAGVPADAEAAMAWYRRAAGQGSAMAQYNLGILYGTGPGTVRDEVRSWAWLARAAEQGLDIATEARTAIARHMSAAQIADAERLAVELRSPGQ